MTTVQRIKLTAATEVLAQMKIDQSFGIQPTKEEFVMAVENIITMSNELCGPKWTTKTFGHLYTAALNLPAA
jgi:hypothetical protein